MKVAIVGSRYYSNYESFEGHLFLMSQIQWNPIYVHCIISGGYKDVIGMRSRGTDTLAEIFAEKHGFIYKGFPAQWKVHGRAAGPIRNTQIAEACDVCIAFVADGSKGTLDTIKKVKALEKPCYTFKITKYIQQEDYCKCEGIQEMKDKNRCASCGKEIYIFRMKK